MKGTLEPSTALHDQKIEGLNLTFWSWSAVAVYFTHEKKKQLADICYSIRENVHKYVVFSFVLSSWHKD